MSAQNNNGTNNNNEQEEREVEAAVGRAYVQVGDGSEDERPPVATTQGLDCSARGSLHGYSARCPCQGAGSLPGSRKRVKGLQRKELDLRQKGAGRYQGCMASS